MIPVTSSNLNNYEVQGKSAKNRLSRRRTEAVQKAPDSFHFAESGYYDTGRDGLGSVVPRGPGRRIRSIREERREP